MNYDVGKNNFVMSAPEFSSGKIQTVLSTIQDEFKKHENFDFNLENGQYQEASSEIYNKIYSIFLNIIEKSNENVINSDPKKYFDMLISYSLQKSFKRKYNESFEYNYIPEIVGIYDFTPDDKYKGIIIVFDIPSFSNNENIDSIKFEISEVRPAEVKQNKISFSVELKEIMIHTATYMPYIYNKHLVQVATNKNYRCYKLDVLNVHGKRFKIEENNVYDIFLTVDYGQSIDSSLDYYNFLNPNVISDLNSKITEKSPITSNYGYKQMNINDFSETIENRNDDKISLKYYLSDYMNITYKDAVNKGMFEQNISGLSSPTGSIFKDFMDNFKREKFFFNDSYNLNIHKIIAFLNQRNGKMYEFSLWPRGQKTLIGPSLLPCLLDLGTTIEIGGRSTDKKISSIIYIYSNGGKYYLADYDALIKEKNFKKIDYYIIDINGKRYKFTEPISLIDVQLLNMAKFLTYLLILAEQGCFINFIPANADKDMPFTLGSINGDLKFNRFDNCIYNLIRERE